MCYKCNIFWDIVKAGLEEKVAEKRIPDEELGANGEKC